MSNKEVSLVVSSWTHRPATFTSNRDILSLRERINPNLKQMGREVGDTHEMQRSNEYVSCELEANSDIFTQHEML